MSSDTSSPHSSAMINLDTARCAQSPLSVCEIKALIKYAAEKGLDREGTILTPLVRLVREQQARQGDGEDLSAQIIVVYAQLAQLTAPVNGRTLLETERQFRRAVLPLHLWTLLILAIVIANEVMKVWFDNIVQPEEGGLLDLIDIRHYVFDVCSPFLWGALGSCVWLLKRLSDIAEGRYFDRSQSHGWTSRILLGAVLGGIVQYLYDPQLFQNGPFRLGASALGFVTGVGVKVVYGAIEKSIEILADKMNLDAKKAGQQGSTGVRDFLNAQLAKTDKEHDPDKHRALLALLGEVKDDTTP